MRIRCIGPRIHLSTWALSSVYRWATQGSRAKAHMIPRGPDSFGGGKGGKLALWMWVQVWRGGAGVPGLLEPFGEPEEEGGSEGMLTSLHRSRWPAAGPDFVPSAARPASKPRESGVLSGTLASLWNGMENGGGEGIGVCRPRLPQRPPEHGEPWKVPENSPMSALTSRKAVWGYTSDTLPCCGYVLLSFLCLRDFNVKLRGSSWVFLMFSGPFANRGSGRVRKLAALILDDR